MYGPGSDTSDKEPVYNLTVAGDHEFFANGVLTHNCDAAYWAWRDLRGGRGGKMTVPQGPMPRPPINTRDGARGGRVWMPGR